MRIIFLTSAIKLHAGWNGILAHQQQAIQNQNEQRNGPPPIQEMSR